MADKDDSYQEEDYIEIKIPKEGEEPTEQEETKTRIEEKDTVRASSTPQAKKKTTKKKKKIVKKTAQATPLRTVKKDEKSYNWVWVLLIIFGILVIAAVIMLMMRDGESTQTQEPEDGQVAALVNGEAIMIADLENIYTRLPPEMQATTSKDDLLEQLIDQELLIQEARNQGVVVTNAEMQAYTDELKAFFGLTEEQLNEILTSQNVDRNEFDENNRQQLLVTKLLNQTLASRIVITEDMIETYYENNRELFMMPEFATVRHILIAIGENESAEELEMRSQEVMDMIDEDYENFCELVTEYSEDLGSVEFCGEYDVAADGQYVPEFEEAALDMNDGELRAVETMFGIHIMWKVSHAQADNIPLEQARIDIESFLEQEAQSNALVSYLEELREEAVIERYPTADAIENMPTSPLTDEEEQELQEQIEIIIQEPEQEPQEEEQSSVVIRNGSLGDCLASQGATMYGVEWSPNTQEQIELLGDTFRKVNYVNCEREDCSFLGAYPTYPTWIIGDKTLIGKQSINALTAQTGCQVN